MVREGIDCLRICQVGYRELDKPFTTPTGNRDDWDHIPPPSYARYWAFLQALHHTTWEIVQQMDATMFLDIFYATMVLSIIRRILYDSETSREYLGPFFRAGSASPSYQPMIRVLETSNKALSEVYGDAYLRNNFLANSGPFCSPWIFTNNALFSFGSNDTPVGELKRFIDRVELKGESAGIGLRDRAVSEDWA